jgi:hypothetical protein
MSYWTTKILLAGNITDQTGDVLVFLCHEANNLWNTTVYQIRKAHLATCGIREFFDKDDCFRRQFKDIAILNDL